MLMLTAFVVETAVWLFVTTMITLWVTRTYINSICAIFFGRVTERRAVSGNAGAQNVAVIVATYNEADVIDRVLNAVTRIDYPSYEVIVADDSTDPLMLQKLRTWRGKRGVRVIHRSARKGFKAGALNNAINHIRSDCKYVLLFDADYLPQKGIIRQMLPNFSSDEIAAVQGYTKHTLNAPQNAFTKAVSLSFSAYCMVDMPMRMRLNGFVPLFGSVCMIRTAALRRVGGFSEESITEDYELACRLAEHGYRTVFDETVSVPAECPSTYRVLLRQQMRWAEGIMRDTRRHFHSFMRSKRIGMMKKFDYMFYGLGSVNGVFGAISYALAAWVFVVSHGLVVALAVDYGLILGLGAYGKFMLYVAPVYIPLALVLASFMGLYRENRLHNFGWSIYLVLVSLTLSPFIAYSSIRGLLLKRGSWTRTTKTGRVYGRSAASGRTAGHPA